MTYFLKADILELRFKFKTFNVGRH